MEISAFQALCLLPDNETFKAFRRELSVDRQKWRYRKFDTTLEAVHEMATDHYTARIYKRRGVGILVGFGRHISLQADRVKVKRWLDANGYKWQRNSTE